LEGLERERDFYFEKVCGSQLSKLTGLTIVLFAICVLAEGY